MDTEQARRARDVAGRALQRRAKTLLRLDRRHLARAQRVGEVSDRDRLLVGADQRALHDVLEFAHVTGPRVAGEGLDHVVAEGGDLLARARAQAPEEVVGERGHVLPPLAQGRQREVEDVEAVVEVLAEAAVLDVAAQVAVRGGHDAQIDGSRPAVADPLELPLLEHAQELPLDLGRDVSDLVEEDRAAVGELDTPLAVAVRAREAAAKVAEELGFEEILRVGGAVHRHEGTRGARALRVQRARDQLLAGAALAADQDGRVVRGDVADPFHDVLHHRRDADHAVEDPPLLECLADPLPRRDIAYDHGHMIVAHRDRVDDHRAGLAIAAVDLARKPRLRAGQLEGLARGAQRPAVRAAQHLHAVPPQRLGRLETQEFGCRGIHGLDAPVPVDCENGIGQDVQEFLVPSGIRGKVRAFLQLVVQRRHPNSLCHNGPRWARPLRRVVQHARRVPDVGWVLGGSQ